MGQYLTIGIATKIYLRKNHLKKENLENSFTKNFKISIYDVSEYEDYFVLTLKEDVLEHNIIELLNEMKQKASHSQQEKYIKAEEQLKGKKYKELIEIADEKSVYKFQLVEGARYICNDISYILEEGDAFCDIIGIESDGKVFFECYSNIFTFIRNSIIESLKNELKYALVITIKG